VYEIIVTHIAPMTRNMQHKEVPFDSIVWVSTVDRWIHSLIERLVSPDKEEERIETSSKDNVNGFREAHQEDDHKENAAPFSFHGQSTKRTIKIEIKIEIKRKGKERKGKERKGKERKGKERKGKPSPRMPEEMPTISEARMS